MLAAFFVSRPTALLRGIGLLHGTALRCGAVRRQLQLNWEMGLALGSLACVHAQAQAQPPSPQAVVAQSALATGAILQAIVSYTRWPQRPASLGLCISRSASDAQEIARQVQPLHDGRQLDVHLIEANQTALPAQCQAVYLEGWQPETLRLLLRSLAQQPVLTLGRGPEFCSDGGMFCLEAQDGRTRFEVNLDAVARSGLRVHPQVLRLAQPPGRKA